MLPEHPLILLLHPCPHAHQLTQQWICLCLPIWAEHFPPSPPVGLPFSLQDTSPRRLSKFPQGPVFSRSVRSPPLSVPPPPSPAPIACSHAHKTPSLCPQSPAFLSSVFFTFSSCRLLHPPLITAPWTAKIKQVNNKRNQPEYSLEGLLLKLQYLGHLMQRADSLEKKPRCKERLKAKGEGGN